MSDGGATPCWVPAGMSDGDIGVSDAARLGPNATDEAKAKNVSLFMPICLSRPILAHPSRGRGVNSATISITNDIGQRRFLGVNRPAS
jgi:hypothetical protein